jgi:excisionase family DNA binding protein
MVVQQARHFQRIFVRWWWRAFFVALRGEQMIPSDAMMMLTSQQAAQALGVSTRRIQALLKAERLRFQRTPLGRLIDPSSVEEYRASRDRWRARHATQTAG